MGFTPCSRSANLEARNRARGDRRPVLDRIIATYASRTHQWSSEHLTLASGLPGQIEAALDDSQRDLDDALALQDNVEKLAAKRMSSAEVEGINAELGTARAREAQLRSRRVGSMSVPTDDDGVVEVGQALCARYDRVGLLSLLMSASVPLCATADIHTSAGQAVGSGVQPARGTRAQQADSRTATVAADIAGPVRACLPVTSPI